ncbi:uncharacterized protein [Venturia canescens]|uniref:uncharacterized protein isoform X2 n=1 Tax=Venturia canescens TaxID=32260 RepID=UPI001C9CA626|nr:uncharacterized protein LOC122409332 isoform X2 [Venturia canescens]
MVRTTRLRKPLSKYPEKDYELNTSPKKSPVKKSKNTEMESKGTKSSLTQGTVRGTAKKSTKPTRTLRSKTSEENKGEVERTRSVGTKKRRKLENGEESTPDGDSKIHRENQSDGVATDKTVLTSKRGTKIVKKSIKSSKSTKVNAEIAKKSERKRAREVDSEEDESVSEITDEKNSSNSEVQPISLAIERPNNQVTAKTTRKTVKSRASREDENQELTKANSPKPSRIRTRRVMTERESSVDSGLDSRGVSEADENRESVKTTKKSVQRLSSRKVATSKKSEVTSRQLTLEKVNEQEDKASKDFVSVNKFFKNKTERRTIEKKFSPIKKTVTGKRRNIGNPRMSVSFHPRQTTLQESFAKQKDRKVLRPRKSQKDYCEETIINQNDTGKEMEAEKRTGPVYKSIKPDEDSIKDKNAIYEFDWDKNDSREKLPKKKKTRNRKNIVAAKVVRPKKTATSKKTIEQRTEIVNTDVVEQISTEPEKLMDQPRVETDNFHEEFNDPPKCEEVIEPPEKLDKSPVVQKGKPKIIESVELRGNECFTLTTTPVLAKSYAAKSRSHLQASKQFRKMLGDVLLNKSISPIVKAIENFDPGSPWRPPVFSPQEFSRIKNVVQSTPQIPTFKAKLGNAPAKTTTACNTERKIDEIITEREEDEAKNSDKQFPKKALDLAKSPRKFGTVISNLDSDSVINTRKVESNKTNSNATDSTPQKIVVYATIETPPTGSASVKSRLADDFVEPMNFENEDVDDKENSLPVVHSPKRSPLKSLNRAPLGNLSNSLSADLNSSPLKNLNRSPLKNLNSSPLKNLNRSPLKNLDRSPLKTPKKSPLKDPKKILEMLHARKLQNENKEPQQAGPSNQKVVAPRDDSKILRQSNLDNYLNLDEMPKSTRIVTPHGIFDDAHSTPIIGKPVKSRSNKAAATVDNAFGFDVSDEDSENEISPIHKLAPEKPVAQQGFAQAQLKFEEKPKNPAPARLSVGDIKKHLLPIRRQEKTSKAAPVVERIEEEGEEKQESHDKKSEPENPRVQTTANPIDFSDTFDISENQRTNESTLKVELFADLEPRHFKQAPRYSYKRKRGGFVLSDAEEDSENVEPGTSYQPKRRKIGKAEKERLEKLENWAKDLNETFEEIEHFDLVVE